jgi:predicted nuclease of predicted toxin-antitoxin system
MGLVEALRKRGIEVRTAQKLNIHRLSDEEILLEARNRGLVLITLDRDFWSDDRFPLQSAGRLIFVDAKD